MPIFGAVAARAPPLVIKGALTGDATAGAANAVNKIAGQGVRIIGKKLIKSPLSSTNIIKILKQKARFSFPRSMLPKQIKKFGVIHNDNFPSSGIHWVFYFNGPKYMQFFDSFGIPPAKEILKYLKTNNKNILYKTSKNIPYNKLLFMWSLLFSVCSKSSRGKTQYNIIQEFS